MSKLSVRRSTDSLEAERQAFVKQQTASITKAINAQENPVKEKHVRRIIMGTFQERGMGTFWSLASRSPLQGNPIICWKFCNTFHKVLQQGHEKVLPEALRHRRYISDLAKMWTHLQEGYGKLNSLYCQLLLTKLEFHQKWPAIPGNLLLKEPETALEKMSENDVNNLFQMSVEVFDYIDALINLEEAIYSSFDLSKNISMTASGQCRLAPLIPVVLDSGQLYDYSVRLLFKLHACLPQDTLSGHRQRFVKQFESLKSFYSRTSTLIYFKNYIQVPSLPKSPPNFFIKASSEATYITQAVVLDTLDADGGKESPQPSREPSLFEEPVAPVQTPIHPQRVNDIFASPNLLVDLSTPSSNGQLQRSPATPPPLPVRHNIPDERDRIIEELRTEIESLKFELERTKKEDQRIIESLKRRLMEMEMQMNEHTNVIETQCQENEDLKAEVAQLALAGSAVVSSQERLSELEAKARANEEKFQKMKDVYGNLRDEHVNLLRKHGEVTKQLGRVQKSTEEQEMARLHAEKFVEQLQQSVEEKKVSEEVMKNEAARQRKALLADAIHSAQDSLRRIMEEMEDPSYATATCTAEYLLSRTEGVNDSLNQLEQQLGCYEQNEQAEVGSLITSIGTFSNILGSFVMKGKATSNMAPADKGESLSNACRNACQEAIDMVVRIEEPSESGGFVNQRNRLDAQLQEIVRVAEAIHVGEGDINSEELGDLVDKEMQSTTDAIVEAERRIEDMLRKSKEADSGVKLEVNARILDSCTDLMKHIRELIENSKHLQREIVSTGRGSATAKEFYKRHHRWTEGLISAAKLVGVGATHLVDASDKVVQGNEKFEALIVSSSEIAACTAQLVASSRVKADKESANLKNLQSSSKKVAAATARVVASAKTGAEMVDEKGSLDFSNLSLTQTKRLEMESKIKVLELESKLEKERVKLDELRKVHYQLAGASEGWDEDEDQYGAIAGNRGTQEPRQAVPGPGGITEYV